MTGAHVPFQHRAKINCCLLKQCARKRNKTWISCQGLPLPQIFHLPSEVWQIAALLVCTLFLNCSGGWLLHSCALRLDSSAGQQLDSGSPRVMEKSSGGRPSKRVFPNLLGTCKLQRSLHCALEVVHTISSNHLKCQLFRICQQSFHAK